MIFYAFTLLLVAASFVLASMISDRSFFQEQEIFIRRISWTAFACSIILIVLDSFFFQVIPSPKELAKEECVQAKHTATEVKLELTQCLENADKYKKMVGECL